jgi:hypothetical protein
VIHQLEYFSALLSPKLLHSLACKSGSTIYPSYSNTS